MERNRVGSGKPCRVYRGGDECKIWGVNAGSGMHSTAWKW